MTGLLRLIIPAILVVHAMPVQQAAAGETGDIIMLAQNMPALTQAPADSAEASPAEELPPMPPMPSARIHISTEKPVPAFPITNRPSADTTATEPAARGEIPRDESPASPVPQASESVTETAQTVGADNTSPETSGENAPVEASEREPQMAEDSPESAESGTASTGRGALPVPGVTDAAAGAAAGAASGSPAATRPPESTQDEKQTAAPQQQQVSAETQSPEPPPDTPMPVPQTSSPPDIPSIFHEEVSLFNTPTANLRTIKVVIDDNYNLRGLVYGEEQGYLRKLESDNAGNFREVWKSPPLNSPVREVFVDDLDGDGGSEIAAYTANGNIFIFSYESNEMIYRTPEGTYDSIRCMIVANVDNDPQKELFFLATRGNSDEGNLIQFDTVSHFDEWTSSDLYSATDMVYGNVDNDEEMEIVLNTGEILSFRFKTVKWESDIVFGSRLYLIDMDDDGIMELVTEYNQSYVRIFDLDQRQEKW